MSTKKQIPVHRLDERFSGIYITPLAVEKPSGPGYEISQPHRHDFYYCVLLDKGAMELEVDFESVRIKAPALFLSYPGQMHRIISARMERGWFIAFEPSVIDKQLRDVLDQCLSQIILLPLSPVHAAGFSDSVKQLYAAYEDDAQLFRQPVLRSMITAFVYQAASAYLSVERLDLSPHSARSIELTKTFRQLLRRHFKSMKKPSEYAADMNVSISHLNDTVRAVTGFSVTYCIQQEVVREAQRLLHHSPLTVKEIAGHLGFEDAQYFNRLFSKVAGLSPGAFRKQGMSAAAG